MHPLTGRAREALQVLTDAFDEPEKLLDTLARAALIPNTSPCATWSPTNRFLVALHGTSDARGFRQWQAINRRVIRGSKSFGILVPRFRKVEEDGEEKQVLIGFMSAPVFRVEDTDGEPLPETVPRQIPRLRAVADALGVAVQYSGAVSDRVLGVYTHSHNDAAEPTERITLYTQHVGTFYHELGHALHRRTGLLREGKSDADERDNEIVAEIAGAVLVRLFEREQVGGQALRYVHAYNAKKKHLLSLLPEIMAVVDMAISLGTTNCDTTLPAAANQ